MAGQKFIYGLLALFGILMFRNGEACTPTYLTAMSYSQTFYSHSSYPSSYSHNYEACWQIQTSDSSKIVALSATYFYLESSSICSYDYLRIFSSSSESGNYIRKCGYISTSSFSTIYSSGRYMYLKFKTDSSTSYAGFSLSYSEVSSSNYDSSQWSTSYSSSSSSSSSGSDFAAIYGGVIGGIFGFLLLVGGTVAIVCICIGVQSANRGRMNNRVNGTGTVVISQQQQQQRPNQQAGMGYNNNGYQGAQPVPPPAFTNQPPPPYGQAVNQPAAYPPPQNSTAYPGVNTVGGPGMESNYPPPPAAYY